MRSAAPWSRRANSMLTSGSLSSSTSSDRRPAANRDIAALECRARRSHRSSVRYAVQLHRLEPHLRRDVAGSLHAIDELLGDRRIEADDRVGAERAVLHGAQRERIDAGTPREVRRAAAERGDGVGHPGTVEVGAQASLRGDGGQLGDLRGRVHGAVIAGDGQRQHRGLRVVRVAPAGRVERLPQRVGRDPEVLAADSRA